MKRRHFLNSAATVAAFQIVPRHVLGGPGFTPPSEMLTRAQIGCGASGNATIARADSPVIAVCDVDRAQLTQGVRRCSAVHRTKPKAYPDFRELLTQPDIDIVTISTPPHWHALMTIAAANSGKDIFCEAPMSRTIAEGQAMVRAVQDSGRVFAVNTLFRFDDSAPFYGTGVHVRDLRKAVAGGLLGWPVRAHLAPATGFDWELPRWSGNTAPGSEEIPNHLNYDFWLGPAPWKPYHSHRVHRTFRGYWDYDGGGLGDRGQHFLDPIQFILGKDQTSPSTVEPDTPPQHPDAVLPWNHIRMRYADGCEIICGNEIANHDPPIPILSGPKGKIYRNLESDIPNLAQTLAGLPDPKHLETDFDAAVRNRSSFALNANTAFRAATLVNIAKIAVRLARPLSFDPKTLRFVDDTQANRFIDQPMRGPWSLKES